MGDGFDANFMVSAIAAVAAVLGAWFGWEERRRRKADELPHIMLEMRRMSAPRPHVVARLSYVNMSRTAWRATRIEGPRGCGLLHDQDVPRSNYSAWMDGKVEIDSLPATCRLTSHLCVPAYDADRSRGSEEVHLFFNAPNWPARVSMRVSVEAMSAYPLRRTITIRRQLNDESSSTKD